MARLFIGLLVAVLTTVLARTIIAVLGLDAKALRLVQPFLEILREKLRLLAWALSAIVGLLLLVLWLVFRFDERLSNWMSPRPALGSLYKVDQPVLKFEMNRTTGKNDAEMAVKLQNGNPELLEFRCELRATVNGKDLDQPLIFNGYVNAGTSTTLITRVRDVPAKVTGDIVEVTGRMRYDVTYYFPANKAGTRRTSKLVEWQTKSRLKGVSGETRIDMFVTFGDEIEE